MSQPETMEIDQSVNNLMNEEITVTIGKLIDEHN